jgi:C4-dicarboxylate transporter DctM subunit
LSAAHAAHALGLLAGLSVSLLLAGCAMDIFSAIVLVVPIMVPVAAAFGGDAVHLGIVFFANMELGHPRRWWA